MTTTCAEPPFKGDSLSRDEETLLAFFREAGVPLVDVCEAVSRAAVARREARPGAESPRDDAPGATARLMIGTAISRSLRAYHEALDGFELNTEHLARESGRLSPADLALARDALALSDALVEEVREVLVLQVLRANGRGVDRNGEWEACACKVSGQIILVKPSVQHGDEGRTWTTYDRSAADVETTGTGEFVDLDE